MHEKPPNGYRTLDLMRGVAALTVALFHIAPDFHLPRPQSAYLAVDLFFALSGFVIAHAYGSRLAGGQSFADFARVRLIRLYPLYLLAFTVGMAAALTPAGQDEWRTGSLLTAVAAGIFMLPAWTGHGMLFPLVYPAWSLFFELLINFVAAAYWRLLSPRILFPLVVISAFALVRFAFYFGHLDLGVDWGGFLPALARVTYSFFLGVLVQRAGLRSRLHVHPVILTGLLLCTFWASPTESWRTLFDLAAILVFFPAVLVLGVSMEPSPRLEPAALVAGQLSYAIYVLHIPLLSLATAFALPKSPANGILLLCGVMLASYLADRFYDGPLRRTLVRARRPVPA